MNAKTFALWSGVAMIVFAVASFFPQLWFDTYAMQALSLETSYGNFLGIFPMNILNKFALIGLGIGGIMASRDLRMAARFSRVLCFVAGALALLGLIPLTQTGFGFWPLYGGEVVAHAVLALSGAYFGFVEVRGAKLLAAHR